MNEGLIEIYHAIVDDIKLLSINRKIKEQLKSSDEEAIYTLFVTNTDLVLERIMLEVVYILNKFNKPALDAFNNLTEYADLLIYFGADLKWDDVYDDFSNFPCLNKDVDEWFKDENPLNHFSTGVALGGYFIDMFDITFKLKLYTFAITFIDTLGASSDIKKNGKYINNINAFIDTYVWGPVSIKLGR